MSLALGAGGARGYAHIGAIQELEERGIEIVGIAGCSMGALVGGVHAAGELDAFADWALSLTQRDVLRLLDVAIKAPGVIRAERVLARVRDLVGDRRIEDLDIPYTAVATDLLARREVWFQRGPLDQAIRASIALPGIFTPVMLNGQLLADGGLMDPLPVAPTAAVPSDATIAISLGGEREGADAGPAGGAVSETTEPRPMDEWIRRFRRGTAQALDFETARALRARWSAPAAAEAAAEEVEAVVEAFDELPVGLTRFDVMNHSLEAMQDLVTRYRMAAFPADVTIEIPRNACGTLDFHRAAHMVELGRELTARRLDELAADARG
ncbi:MAG TPA: patatin-like phospholipase family protein [Solirubrobacteraceae bacterium]|nr:patatin-like phospholipase family protein [Solirubrobacteraceae bacterium]